MTKLYSIKLLKIELVQKNPISLFFYCTGDKILKEFTIEEYDIMMGLWEKTMNHYLIFGEMLIGLPIFQTYNKS